jgi:cytochrome c oxidase subunit 2
MPRSEIAALLLALLAWAPAHATANGRTVYARCVACHGAAGEGVAAVGAPPLAGADAAYLQRQLSAFASGSRGTQPGDKYGATMRAAAAPLLTSDSERVAVAVYLGGLKRPAPAVTTATSANGRNYFNAVCGACHGGNGEGNIALGAPRLAGLPVAYIARQFAAFKNGQRGTAAGDRYGAQMRAVTGMLPDEAAVRDVTAYVASLRP